MISLLLLMIIGMKIFLPKKKLESQVCQWSYERSARKLYTNFLDVLRLPIFMKIEQIFIKIEMTNLVKSNFLTGGSFNDLKLYLYVVKHLSLR